MTAHAIDPLVLPAVQAINSEWVTRLLSPKYPGIEALSCKVVDVIQGAAVKVRLSLHYNEAGKRNSLPSSLIIKGSFGRHTGMWNVRMMENEMRSYSEVVSVSPVNAPHLYYAGHFPDANHPIIVMEDLAERQVTFNSAHSTLTFDQAAALLETLAALHAHWWDSPKLASAPLGSWLEWVHGEGMAAWVNRNLRPQIWQRYMNFPRAIALPRRFKDAEHMRAALDTLRANHTILPWTAVHGDFHVGNTFSDRDGHGGAFDWVMRKGPWHHDVSYFIVNALDIDDRRRWERPLLKHYLETLSEHGAPAPKFEEAWLAYRREILYGLIVWITNGDDQGQFQPEAVNTAGAVRAASAAMDHDVLSLLS